ncbi:hypothetical protein ACSLBF_09610 [Pseudoalteromonas sp. T1lg65]|uniref:hypothetical protein n=1 Tax=Pseudoalteromonas sp. T1lg65 TaxID=2077101 RepID=UPI003F797305
MIYVGTDGDEKLLNCQAVSDQYLSLNPEYGNAKEMYATLLLAFSSQKKLN